MSSLWWSRLIFGAAALPNIAGILLYTRGLTNTALFDVDPVLFGRVGCILVMLWGLAYVAAIPLVPAYPWIALVFAVEKAVYFAAWLRWMALYRDTLPAITATDALAGGFYARYGLFDAVFMGLFVLAYVFTPSLRG